jgi:hypothetical protein
LGAQVGGDLNCSAADLKSQGDTLYADGARIAGTVYLVDGFCSAGTISLRDAQIDENLECSGAVLTAQCTNLYADGARIGDSVFLRNKFSSSTTVRFNGARIGSDIDCSYSRIGNLEFKGTQAGGDLILTGIQQGNLANLDLSNSRFRRLLDQRASWPPGSHLHLDGFVFQDLVSGDQSTRKTPAEERID